MADVINLRDFRKGRRAAGTRIRDPEQAEVFPGVSLADLWRLWAKCEQVKQEDLRAEAAERHRA